MQLCDEYAPLRNKFHGQLRQARLSQTAIDVLSIVAYNQPVSREEIDRLRGSKSGRVLAQLVRRELIRFESSTEDSSHKLYQTTERFLALFALEGLHELPRSDQPE
jgi:segregation and condensation protein B